MNARGTSLVIDGRESLESVAGRSPSLRCDSLTVQFGASRPAVDGVCYEFEAGTITALVGKSGCGKTTLLRSLAQLQQPTSGVIISSPTVDATRGEISFVFQQPTLLPWRTAIDNVALPLHLIANNASKEDIRCRVREELRAMELDEDAFTRFPGELSGGMKMRVSLARALVTRPAVLLLDEPFAALDDMLRGTLGDLLLRRWSERPFTMILVTHNIAEAALLSHRVVVMRQGKMSHTLDNPLPWPRNESLRTSTAFGEFYGRISDSLRDVG
jgi:NitT/TauT family transport system ATP-binding protein